MTREQLNLLITQADKTCSEIKQLRDLAARYCNIEELEPLNDALRAVVHLDARFGEFALDLLRRNV